MMMEERETIEKKISGSKPSEEEEEVVGKSISVQTSKRLVLNKKDIQVLIDEFQKQLELLKNTINNNNNNDNDNDNDDDEEDKDKDEDEGSSSRCSDSETYQLHDLLKSTVESPNFLEKLASVHVSVPQGITEDWDMINRNDLWEGETIDGDVVSDQEGYVIVNQEDVKEGIACFMATYLLSIQQCKELSPNQLQEALSKTFSAKKKKGKLQKAWDGSKVIYNVASYGATAVGIYQNPALVRAASVAFWSSCRIISKLF